MKTSSFISKVMVSAALVPGLAQAADYVPVPLEEPLNWSAGRRLFPGNVIAGYNAGYGEYNKDTWAEHVLQQCKTFSACESSLSFSGRFCFLQDSTRTVYEKRNSVLD